MQSELQRAQRERDDWLAATYVKNQRVEISTQHAIDPLPSNNSPFVDGNPKPAPKSNTIHQHQEQSTLRIIETSSDPQIQSMTKLGQIYGVHYLVWCICVVHKNLL